MYYTRGEEGDAAMGIHEMRGYFEFSEGNIGNFATFHEQHGRFLTGHIEISFSGADGEAGAGLNHPDLARALGFRGDVKIEWEDLVIGLDADRFDRSVGISHKSETTGEKTDYEDIRRAVQLDLAAIDAFLDGAIQAHRRECAAELIEAE